MLPSLVLGVAPRLSLGAALVAARWGLALGSSRVGPRSGDALGPSAAIASGT